jgi:hypothetical protein
MQNRMLQCIWIGNYSSNIINIDVYMMYADYVAEFCLPFIDVPNYLSVDMFNLELAYLTLTL